MGEGLAQSFLTGNVNRDARQILSSYGIDNGNLGITVSRPITGSSGYGIGWRNDDG